MSNHREPCKDDSHDWVANGYFIYKCTQCKWLKVATWDPVTREIHWIIRRSEPC